jgi:hypothetical protein
LVSASNTCQAGQREDIGAVKWIGEYNIANWSGRLVKA